MSSESDEAPKLYFWTQIMREIKLIITKNDIDVPDIIHSSFITFSLFPAFDEELADLGWSLVSELAQVDGDQTVVNPGEVEVHRTNFLSKWILADIGETTAKSRFVE